MRRPSRVSCSSIVPCASRTTVPGTTSRASGASSGAKRAKPVSETSVAAVRNANPWAIFAPASDRFAALPRASLDLFERKITPRQYTCECQLAATVSREPTLGRTRTGAGNATPAHHGRPRLSLQSTRPRANERFSCPKRPDHRGAP